jgi:N-methylhydantoinase B/oxoprolinase/acetone carboxylase alpha subunit
MAGTLTISTLSDGTNSTSATNPILGSAKAWVNFNGTGNAVRDSYNCSSVTIAGGVVTISFTTALSNANYSIVGMTNYNNVICLSSSVIQTTTGFTVTAVGLNPNQVNTVANYNIAVFSS